MFFVIHLELFCLSILVFYLYQITYLGDLNEFFFSRLFIQYSYVSDCDIAKKKKKSYKGFDS